MLKRYFIAGVLIWVPIWATLLIIDFFVRLFDRIVQFLPTQYQPEEFFKMHIPGLSILIVLLLIFFTGVLVSNVFGRYLLHYWERLLQKIPLVRTIYAGVQQILQAMFVSSDKAFRKVLLIEYPRKGIWTIAFQTGPGSVEARTKIGTDLISVFVPTTPNPTSGFMLLISAQEVIELEMSVDAALKMVISLGVINTPNPESITAQAAH